MDLFLLVPISIDLFHKEIFTKIIFTTFGIQNSLLSGIEIGLKEDNAPIAVNTIIVWVMDFIIGMGKKKMF